MDHKNPKDLNHRDFMPVVLYLDNDRSRLAKICKSLNLFFTTVHCHSLEDALIHLSRGGFSALLAPGELLAPVEEGMLKEPSVKGILPPVILFGGNPTPESIRRGFLAGISDWILSDNFKEEGADRLADSMDIILKNTRKAKEQIDYSHLQSEPAPDDISHDETCRRAIAASQDGIWEFSDKGLCFSRAFYKILRWGGDTEINSGNLHGFIHKEDYERAMNILCSIVETVETDERERRATFRVLTGDGRWHWILARGKSVKVSGKTIVTGLLTSADQYLKSQEKMRETNQLLKTILEGAPLPIFSLDNTGRVQHIWNPAAEKVLGWKKEEVMGRILPTVPPEDMNTFIRRMKYVSAGNTLTGEESSKRLRKDGGEIYYSIYNAPLYNMKSEIEGSIAILIDLTEIRKARAEIEEHHDRYWKIFNANLDGLLVIDSNWTIVDANRQAHRLYGFEQGSMKGIDVRSLTNNREKTEPENLRRYMQAVFDGNEITGEIVAKRIDGTLFDAETKAVSIELKGARHILVIVRDITQTKRTQHEKESLIKKLELKNAEMERYAYTVSHDLRGPLITIRGFIGWLKADVEKGKTDRILVDLERINTAALRLENLLNDLLNLTRVNEIVTKIQNVSLTGIFNEGASLLSERAKEIGLKFIIQQDMPIVFGDLQRMKEVAFNLLENAVKFSRPGESPEVRVTAAIVSGNVVCSVKDNGIGINPRYHARIFGIFDKLDQKSEGTGVGLAIVRRIIQLHDGVLWVESDGTGKGSTFHIQLPPGKDDRVNER